MRLKIIKDTRYRVISLGGFLIVSNNLKESKEITTEGDHFFSAEGGGE